MMTQVSRSFQRNEMFCVRRHAFLVFYFVETNSIAESKKKKIERERKPLRKQINSETAYKSKLQVAAIENVVQTENRTM